MALVLSIVSLGITVITEQPIWLMIVTGVAIAVAALLSTVLPAMVNMLYPNRDLPKAAEKDYAKKLLAASDEGERHVMFRRIVSHICDIECYIIIGVTFTHCLFCGHRRFTIIRYFRHCGYINHCECAVHVFYSQ